MNPKPWYTSKTILVGLVAIASGLQGLIDADLIPDSTKNYFLIAVGLIVAWLRPRTTTTIAPIIAKKE